MKNNQKVIFVRTDDAELHEVVLKAAELRNQTVSQFGEEALREKINKVARKFPQLSLAPNSEPEQIAA